MYTKRIQLVSYGPIEKLDIEFPFESGVPKPVVLVGENGSGKTILLSHIVNGLIAAKGVAFPETPEVASGKVYKLRSSAYIMPGHEYYFARVDYDEALHVSELRLRQTKLNYSQIPDGISGTAAESIWTAMSSNTNDHYDSSILSSDTQKTKIEKTFSENCVLYFPFDRSEDPAWLNEDNLTAQAQYMDLKHLSGNTSRHVIAQSPLHDNQNWLFDVIYDRSVLETKTANVPFGVTDGGQPISLPVQLGPSGNAATIYQIALRVVQNIMNNQNARFGIGPRLGRVVSLEADPLTIVPNIFQLSSGETTLLNLFLSILRDFDLSGSTFSRVEDIRGVVVVDEIDLHLHTVHQYEVLPALIQMFPKVQFIVTTHSPLFVLGMKNVLRENGFALYRLPQGQQISPEEFSEFGDAYQAFAETRTFNNDVRAAIEKSHKPIVFVEGTTDQRYIEKASTLFGKETILEAFEIRDGGGSGKLAKIWKDSVLPLTETLPYQVLLLFDCDTARTADNKGKLLQRTIPLQVQSPIKKGVENLFSKSTLEMARQHKPAFFRTEEEHSGTDEDGKPITIPEKWTVNDNEKANLCDWLCENGTQEDFRHFQVIFDLIEEALDLTPSIPADAESPSTQWPPSPKPTLKRPPSAEAWSKGRTSRRIT